MTEKRFTYMEQFNGFCDVYDNGKILSCMRLEYVENTVNLLNELNDKCEFLEIENEALEDGATMYAELCHKLSKENEQLKQFQDRVFSWIDMHLQRLPTLRDDEFESDNEFADPSLYSGAIQILETMKKELIGDVE